MLTLCARGDLVELPHEVPPVQRIDLQSQNGKNPVIVAIK
jgi:hypothetical protein